MTNDDERKKPVHLTRDELYRRVWEMPMSRLAAQYGISGNGLAKICKRLEVPYPPRGHWAKKAAGNRVINHRLPPANEDTLLEVTITPTPPALKLPALSPDLADTLKAARLQAESVVVPNRLTKPHPIIAGWLADHERRKREVRRDRNPVGDSLCSSGVHWQ